MKSEMRCEQMRAYNKIMIAKITSILAVNKKKHSHARKFSTIMIIKLNFYISSGSFLFRNVCECVCFRAKYCNLVVLCVSFFFRCFSWICLSVERKNRDTVIRNGLSYFIPILKHFRVHSVHIKLKSHEILPRKIIYIQTQIRWWQQQTVTVAQKTKWKSEKKSVQTL